MSFSEILLIFLIALIVFGPQKIPQIAGQIGTLIAHIKIYFDTLKNDIYTKSGFNEVKNMRNEITDIYHNLKQNINIKDRIEHNEFFDDSWSEKIYIYFQPELDFDYQPELFDEFNNY